MPELDEAPYCEFETDVNEVCGEPEVTKLETKIAVPRNVLSEVTKNVKISADLCSEHRELVEKRISEALKG